MQVNITIYIYIDIKVYTIHGKWIVDSLTSRNQFMTGQSYPGFRTRCFQFHMPYLCDTFYMHDRLSVTSIVKYSLQVQTQIEIDSPYIFFISLAKHQSHGSSSKESNISHHLLPRSRMSSPFGWTKNLIHSNSPCRGLLLTLPPGSESLLQEEWIPW